MTRQEMKHQDYQQSKDYSIRYFFYAAAIATAIAGLLHLRLFLMVSDRGINEFGVFFLISGILQLFWIIPLIRRWGRKWYYVGLGGTVILIIMWALTRVPNPITPGRALPINSISIITEFFQFAFIALIALIIIFNERGKKAAEMKHNVK